LRICAKPQKYQTLVPAKISHLKVMLAGESGMQKPIPQRGHRQEQSSLTLTYSSS